MLWKTHLAIGIFFMFIFLPVINQDISFSVALIAASLIPDIPRIFSKNSKGSSIIRDHSMLHSFTFAFTTTFILSLFFPSMALGFFLGYSIHLFADSLTKEGIQPFWPLKSRNSWRLRTGGYVETSILIGFVIGDALLLLVFLL